MPNFEDNQPKQGLTLNPRSEAGRSYPEAMEIMHDMAKKPKTPENVKFMLSVLTDLWTQIERDNELKIDLDNFEGRMIGSPIFHDNKIFVKIRKPKNTRSKTESVEIHSNNGLVLDCPHDMDMNNLEDQGVVLVKWEDRRKYIIDENGKTLWEMDRKDFDIEGGYLFAGNQSHFWIHDKQRKSDVVKNFHNQEIAALPEGLYKKILAKKFILGVFVGQEGAIGPVYFNDKKFDIKYDKLHKMTEIDGQPAVIFTNGDKVESLQMDGTRKSWFTLPTNYTIETLIFDPTRHVFYCIIAEDPGFIGVSSRKPRFEIHYLNEKGERICEKKTAGDFTKRRDSYAFYNMGKSNGQSVYCHVDKDLPENSTIHIVGQPEIKFNPPKPENACFCEFKGEVWYVHRDARRQIHLMNMHGDKIPLYTTNFGWMIAFRDQILIQHDGGLYSCADGKSVKKLPAIHSLLKMYQQDSEHLFLSYNDMTARKTMALNFDEPQKRWPVTTQAICHFGKVYDEVADGFVTINGEKTEFNGGLDVLKKVDCPTIPFNCDVNGKQVFLDANLNRVSDIYDEVYRTDVENGELFVFGRKGSVVLREQIKIDHACPP